MLKIKRSFSLQNSIIRIFKIKALKLKSYLEILRVKKKLWFSISFKKIVKFFIIHLNKLRITLKNEKVIFLENV